MKKVILNLFVLIPLALFMMIYVDGQSEKKVLKKKESSQPKVSDNTPEELASHFISTETKNLALDGEN